MSVRTMAQITPEVLAWARNTAGFSHQEIAEKIKQKSAAPETIEAWEQGRAQPTYAQLEKLANIYKRPIAIFFFPAPPEEPALDERFRSLPGVFAQSLPPQIRYLVRKALARQIDLYDLYGEDTPSDIKIFRQRMEGIPRNDVNALAGALREIIGIPLDVQFGWTTTESALKQWRNGLENIGFWIFKDAFNCDDYCGFCLYDQNFPLVYLNNNMPKQRQIFTLFHEVGHLLMEKGGVDFRSDVENMFQDRYLREETFCNAFAGKFLVPDDSFPISGSPDDKQIADCAKKYKVSREVVLRKYLDRNLITREFYNGKVAEWHESWQGREHKREGRSNYYATTKTYLGDKYLNFLFKQYYRQRIDEYELADYLGVKVESIQTLEGYVPGGRG